MGDYRTPSTVHKAPATERARGGRSGAMKIGEIAKRSGIGIETIRYCEREGLLQEPERQPSGYRQ